MVKRLKEMAACSGQAVGYILEEITHICRDMAPRSPGSKGEREAAEYMAGVLEKDCGCVRVSVEPFEVCPDAFWGYFCLSAALNALCAACFFIRPWLSLAFGGLSLLLFLFQFVFYRKVIDPLFPVKESVNVTAVRPCSGVTRRRIFLSGHTDTAWEFPLNHYFGGVVFELPGIMATIGVLYYIALAICAVCGAYDRVRTAGLWGLLFVPFFILLAFTCNPKRVVDGANDNLSGCYIGIALLREMEIRGITPENTEIGVILTGSEEAGTRGAKAWARAHREDFRDVPTYIVCFDTIHDPRFLMVNRRDLNGTVASDAGLCDAFLKAAERAGVPCTAGKVPLFGGSTDSAAFTQGAFRSVGVTGLNHVLEDYYHTRRDTYGNMDAEGLENCFRAAVMLVDIMDRE